MIVRMEQYISCPLSFRNPPVIFWRFFALRKFRSASLPVISRFRYWGKEAHQSLYRGCPKTLVFGHPPILYLYHFLSSIIIHEQSRKFKNPKFPLFFLVLFFLSLQKPRNNLNKFSKTLDIVDELCGAFGYPKCR